MSGRAPQKPPTNALRIRTDSPDEEEQIYQWMTVGNGFPFYIPEDAELYLSRDGRTLYGEKFLVRIPSPWSRPQTGRVVGKFRDTYALTPNRSDLVRKRFAYPIVRSLWDYAPELATRIGLTKESHR